MRKIIAAVAVSLAILFGMAVKADAGTAIGCSMASRQAVLDKNDGDLYLCTAKKDEQKAGSVNLRRNHCETLTEGGSLYMRNKIDEYGQLGNVTQRAVHNQSEKVTQTVYMQLIIKYPMLKADNTSNTKVIATVHKSNGEIDEAIDGIEVKFSAELGRMDADTVTIHNGKAENIFYSPVLSDTRSVALSAEIIASDKFPELNSHKVTGSVLLLGSEGASVSQKITYRSPAIKKGKVAYGSSFLLNARTTGTGKLSYQSSNTKILSVNTNGRATVKGYGPVSVKIKAAGGNGYKAAVRKIKLIAVPRKGKIIKADWQKNGVFIQWKPEKIADGYEYAIAYNKKFSGQSRKKTKKTGLILTKYKTGTKRMFIKVRTYKKAGKKIYYGSWSKPRTVKLKKSRKTGQSSFVIEN